MSMKKNTMKKLLQKYLNVEKHLWILFREIHQRALVFFSIKEEVTDNNDPDDFISKCRSDFSINCL